ncbi:unnamed protein product [Rotaria sp. Silwood1]|nr:unnamed protein product [Rotaria sp. Silwood1]
MEGTGRFTTTAFEQRKLPQNRLSSSTSSSLSSSPSDSPQGIILKPTIVVKKSSSIHEDNEQFSDRDVDSSISSKSKERKQPLRHQLSIDDEDEDEDLLLSTKTGEKIYSTDFEESKSKARNISNYDDEDDDVADTMKLSARSLNAAHRRSFDSDDDDDDDD